MAGGGWPWGGSFFFDLRGKRDWGRAGEDLVEMPEQQILLCVGGDD